MNLYQKAGLVFIFTLLGFMLFNSMNQLSSLTLVPWVTPQVYLNQIPHVDLLGVILQQPSSTVLVMLLALVTTLLGITYLYKSSQHFFRWLGINFIFWGIGAFLAGLSYQAFGYQLKCVGYEACLFTDWVELLYMSFTVLSINALLLAYLYITHNSKWRKFLQIYPFISALLYILFQGLGMILPHQFMVSYEGMLMFLSPNIVLMMIINAQNRNVKIHRELLRLWILFLGVNLAYFVALFGGQGAFLLKSFNLWFNENDTLHILLIVWMIYFGMRIKTDILDHK